MSFELNNRSAPCSRRCLLLGAVAAVSAVTVVDTDPSTAVAALKISQAAVGYQDHPNGDKECRKCVEFQPPSSCKMVDGTINPQGYCRIFMPIHPAANRLGASPTTG
jgi:hypothetical protein